MTGILRIIGWIFASLSMLSLIENLNLIKIVGLVRQWIDAYNLFIETIQIYLFGWIDIWWLSVSEFEVHIFIICLNIYSSIGRTLFRQEKEHKIHRRSEIQEMYYRQLSYMDDIRYSISTLSHSNKNKDVDIDRIIKIKSQEKKGVEKKLLEFKKKLANFDDDKNLDLNHIIFSAAFRVFLFVFCFLLVPIVLFPWLFGSIAALFLCGAVVMSMCLAGDESLSFLILLQEFAAAVLLTALIVVFNASAFNHHQIF